MADHYESVREDTRHGFDAEVNRLAAEGYGMGEFQVVTSTVPNQFVWVAVMVKYDYEDGVEGKEEREKALTAETPYDAAIERVAKELEMSVDPSVKVHKADHLQVLWKARRNWRTKGASSFLENI